MRRGMRIRTKVVVLTTLAMSILTIILSMIGYSRFNDNVVESYAEYVVAAVKSADSVFDSCGMGDLINKRMMDDNYEAARSGLNNIKNNFDIKYLYGVYYEDIDDLYSLCYVINGKSDEEREEIFGKKNSFASFMSEQANAVSAYAQTAAYLDANKTYTSSGTVASSNASALSGVLYNQLF